jgi:hypothetical protein
VNGVLLLQGFAITEGHATALGNYLAKSEDVTSLIIDDTSVSDESLSKVLSGLPASTSQIVYQSKSFGEHSLNALKRLIPTV